MSRWNHNICIECWNKKYGTQLPYRLIDDSIKEVCCYCGSENTDAIYVRDDPKSVKCNGVHPE